MFNLNEIIQASQGGQGLSNLAAQFGLSPQQTQAALDALLPAVSKGLQTTAQAGGGGLGDIIGHMMNGANQTTFQNPQAAQAPSAATAGGNVLGQIFGGNTGAAQVAQHASQISGISPDILKSMLPVIASMIMGGMFHSMQNQGMGGILGQLAGAAMGGGQQPAQAGAAGGGLGGLLGGLFGGQQGGGAGGLGNILGGLLGGGQPVQPSQAGGGMGGLGNILGGMFGGGQPGAAAGGSPALQAGLDALTKMMQAGTQMQAAHQQGLQDIFAQMTGKK